MNRLEILKRMSHSTIDVNNFRERIKEIEQTGDIDTLFDAIYNFVNDHLLLGHFTTVDLILEIFEPEDFTVPTGVAFLCFTARAKDKLDERDRIWHEVFEKMKREDGEEAATACLHSLQ